MLNAIEGFDQQGMINVSRSTGIPIDVADLVLLRWFVLMRGLGLLERRMTGGKEFAWVPPALVIEHIPILSISSDRVIVRRFNKLAKAGLLEGETKRFGKGKGTKVYYAVTDTLIGLHITNDRKHSKVSPKTLGGTQKYGEDVTSEYGVRKRSKEEEGEPIGSPAASPKWTPEHHQLAALLADLVEANAQNFFRAKNRNATTDKWADDIRLLNEIDGYEPQEIESVMRWATSDSFWKSIILSARKLRDTFVMLRIQMGSSERRDTDDIASKKTGPSLML